LLSQKHLIVHDLLVSAPKKIDIIFLLFRTLLSEILSRRSRISQTTSDPALRSILKWKISGQNIAFFCFSGGENFVTPLSTFANNKPSYPSNSTTPGDRLRERIRSDGEEFPAVFALFFRASPKNVLLYRIRYLLSADLHPKRSQ
tara:strand:- start:1556 stop:1990 length:435 start_codon:yes stop_codon:yes gene_type:complete